MGKPLGIVCPKCGHAQLRTTNTRRLPDNRTRRYKRCRKCCRRMTTIELTMADLQKMLRSM